ncbi:hypothetical protein MCAP1_000952 [Malassezia caprae]|uniref:Uncharacterized protein n=1 Tax=Malassezia caprae TaxID=1381934 RepID=A0AAF0IUJ1_9BASI|nr:hypothetical protein MCAP1_000952 [Malassezia caprae]
MAQAASEHRALLGELEAELELEKRDCEEYAGILTYSHKTSLQELQQMAQALTRPPPRLASDAKASDLLRMIVNVTESAFTEKRLCVQLRVLLEDLMNAIWDTPSDPYVSTRGYDPAVLAFVQRAGLTEAHPAEASVMRLVAFHEPMPDPSVMRPTLYK